MGLQEACWLEVIGVKLRSREMMGGVDESAANGCQTKEARDDGEDDSTGGLSMTVHSTNETPDGCLYSFVIGPGGGRLAPRPLTPKCQIGQQTA